MQLTELQLLNWGPFYLEHTIPLEVSSTAPVVLFRGENMRGKTSLLRAIVWCLYGEVREQDGRTQLEVSRLVNVDAVQDGPTQVGVRLKFTHGGVHYTLHRSADAVQDDSGETTLHRPAVDLIPSGGSPFPAAQVPEIIDGILSREISDFFLFDGEMLNRFEERLRAERSTSQGFVRAQVERALGLPFLRDLSRDLDVLGSSVTDGIEQVLRKSKQHEKLRESYREKMDDLASRERDLSDLRNLAKRLAADIADLEGELSKVDEIKDLYYERKSLERDIDSTNSSIADLRDAMADRAETVWWLPIASKLAEELQTVEDQIVQAEETQRDRLVAELRIGNIKQQLDSGHCASCGQTVKIQDEAELRAELTALDTNLALFSTDSLEWLRPRRDKLRRFSAGASQLQWVHDQERDLRKERMRNNGREQRLRQISESLSGETVEIEVLERNLGDRKFKQKEVAQTIEGLQDEHAKAKQEAQKIGAKLADQPEVDELDRQLQRTISEALATVSGSFEAFRTSMRERVQTATSELFRQLTTEKEYRGVAITEDYLLSLTDQQDRPMSVISAGANQILTMAFIGALAECSVEEAPMVMDTPFGRLDVGHRSAILQWVSTFETQVIMFVQSGEYDPERDSALLAGKIGRDFSIDRLSPSRSEVNAS